jgi:enediyne biosynthesis protein E4
VDIVVTNTNQSPDLLRNDGGTGNHWLAIRCIGVKSNRDGIGARITVETAGLTQIREIRSGGSYLSQGALRVYFGLGKSERADVEIRWPSGVTQTLRGIAADQLFVVKEN